MGVTRRDVESANIDRKYWDALYPKMPDVAFTENINRLANDPRYYEELKESGYIVVLTTEGSSAVRDLGIYLIKGALNQDYSGYVVSSDQIIQCSFNRNSCDYGRSNWRELRIIKNRDFAFISEVNTNKTDPIRKVIRDRNDALKPTFCAFEGTEAEFKEVYESLAFRLNDSIKFIELPNNWRLSR